jgi:adenosylhomocysteine nucleosidase
MPSELRPLIRPFHLRRAGDDKDVYEGSLGTTRVTAMRTGMGMQSAARVTERILDRARPDHVIVVGVAGGVDERLAIGDVIAPEVVVDGKTWTEYRPDPLRTTTGQPASGALHTSDELIVEPERLADLARRGVIALDMETAAVAAVCQQRGCPWSVFRAISDRVSDGIVDDDIFKLSGPDGSPRMAAVVAFVLRHPGRIGHLAKLGRDLQKATTAAAAAAIDACAHVKASGQ